MASLIPRLSGESGFLLIFFGFFPVSVWLPLFICTVLLFLAILNQKGAMTMVLLAIFTGAASLLNYYTLTNSLYPLLLAGIIQLVLFILTTAAAIGFRGRKSRPSYNGVRYSIWTFSFALIVISLIGNFSILVVLLLKQLNIISNL